MKISLILTSLLVIHEIDLILSSEIALLPLAQKIINATMTDCTLKKELTFKDYNSMKKTSAKKISKMALYHIVGKKTFTYKFNDAYDMITTSRYFDTSIPTIIYVKGFFGEFFPNAVQSIIKNLKNIQNLNLFILKNDVFMSGTYYYAHTGARIVGEALGELLAKLYLNGYGNFHLVGHSLGAHASGFAGKVFKQLTSVNLKRISALDPAGPCFYHESPDLRLKSTDADFVDAIHTNINEFGIIDQLGHVDFYPNSGTLQPGCFILGCSHLRAIDFFGESIINDQFIAVQCSDWNTYLSGGCINNNRVNMGYWTPTTARGVYFFETDKKSPYALGVDGTLSG